jgi:hypothetical protein
MKNQNNKVMAVLFVVALALAPMVQATPQAQGGPGSVSSRNAPTARPRPAAVARPDRTPVNLGADDSAGENSKARGGIFSSNLPTITVHSTDNVIRGKTGTFVLHMTPALMFGGTYVNFSLSGTAVQGADYRVPASPAYISQSGYGVIQIETLPDLRGGGLNQAYSVVVTLQAGAGYAAGKSNSAIMWIKP